MQIPAIICFIVLAHIALAGSRVAVSLHALQTLRVDAWTVGTIISLFALVSAPLAVPMGRLVDRIGPKRPMTVGASAIATGLAVALLFRQVTALHLAAVLIGTGWLGVHVGGMHLIGSLSTPETRLRHFNWLSIGYSVGILVGPFSAGFLIDQFGHRAAFVALLCTALTPIALSLAGRNLLRDLRCTQEPSRTGGALEVLGYPGLRPVFYVGTLVSVAWDLFNFIVPVQGSSLGFSASTIGAILGVFGAATFAVRVVMPHLERAHGEWGVLRGALAVLALCFVTLPLVESAFSYMMISALIGLALGSCLPNTLSLLHTHAPAGRQGEAGGIRITITNTSQVGVPLLVGGAGVAVGLLPALWTVAAVLGTGARVAHRQLLAQAERPHEHGLLTSNDGKPNR